MTRTAVAHLVGKQLQHFIFSNCKIERQAATDTDTEICNSLLRASVIYFQSGELPNAHVDKCFILVLLYNSTTAGISICTMQGSESAGFYLFV